MYSMNCAYFYFTFLSYLVERLAQTPAILGWWESCCSQETPWGWTHERQPHWMHSLYELTCDSHASVVFAFLYGVHDLVRTANKTLGTALETHHKETLCSTAPQQADFIERQLLAKETMTYCIRLMLSETKLWRVILLLNFLFISLSY